MITTYFKKYIRIAPFTLAIWRSCEAEALSSVKLTRPMLDLGCGFGEFGGVFFESQVEVGVDLSKEDLEMAQSGKKYKKLVPADARKLPFRARAFNTVVSLSVLEHIPQTTKALSESYRVLKSGGTLVFTVPTMIINDYLVFPKLFRFLGLPKVANWYVTQFHRVFKHENVWTPQQWISETKKAGFKKVTCRGTTPQTIIEAFDLLLFTGLPSQILRWLFGKRFIVGGEGRARIFEGFFKLLTRDTKTTEGNILIIARK